MNYSLDRRDFLKSLSLCAVGLGLTGCLDRREFVRENSFFLELINLVDDVVNIETTVNRDRGSKIYDGTAFAFSDKRLITVDHCINAEEVKYNPVKDISVKIEGRKRDLKVVKTSGSEEDDFIALLKSKRKESPRRKILATMSSNLVEGERVAVYSKRRKKFFYADMNKKFEDLLEGYWELERNWGVNFTDEQIVIKKGMSGGPVFVEREYEGMSRCVLAGLILTTYTDRDNVEDISVPNGGRIVGMEHYQGDYSDFEWV